MNEPMRNQQLTLKLVAVGLFIIVVILWLELGAAQRQINRVNANLTKLISLTNEMSKVHGEFIKLNREDIGHLQNAIIGERNED